MTATPGRDGCGDLPATAYAVLGLAIPAVMLASFGFITAGATAGLAAAGMHIVSMERSLRARLRPRLTQQEMAAKRMRDYAETGKRRRLKGLLTAKDLRLGRNEQLDGRPEDRVGELARGGQRLEVVAEAPEGIAGYVVEIWAGEGRAVHQSEDTRSRYRDRIGGLSVNRSEPRPEKTQCQ